MTRQQCSPYLLSVVQQSLAVLLESITSRMPPSPAGGWDISAHARDCCVVQQVIDFTACREPRIFDALHSLLVSYFGSYAYSLASINAQGHVANATEDVEQSVPI